MTAHHKFLMKMILLSIHAHCLWMEELKTVDLKYRVPYYPLLHLLQLGVVQLYFWYSSQVCYIVIELFLHIILSSVFVLGRLGPPNNITSTHVNSTHVFITWNPPPTDSGSSITGYNVTITNTNSGESVTFYVMEPSLLYQINHPDNFTVTVVALNAAGFGEPVTSSEFTSPFPSGKCTKE